MVLYVYDNMLEGAAIIPAMKNSSGGFGLPAMFFWPALTFFGSATFSEPNFYCLGAKIAIITSF